MRQWYVYVLRCADNTLYTGITTDVERRLTEHNSSDSPRGARYTRSRRPVALAYVEACVSRSNALRREAEIRKLDRAGKDNLIESVPMNLSPREAT